MTATVVVLAGCGGEAVADPIDEGEIQVTMEEQNDSNVAGVRAVLTYVQKDSTKVLVDGAAPGEPSSGGRLTAQLRRGSCADPGAIAYDLGQLERGTTTKTIQIGLPELLNDDYAVEVVGAADVGVIACGDLPDRLPS